MSERLSKLAWSKSVPSCVQKCVLVALADYATESGMLENSMAEIAEKCCLTEQGLRYQMRKLQKLGLLEVHERVGETNIYVVFLK